MAQRPHLFIPERLTSSTEFTSPNSVPRSAFNLPQRVRATHARLLLQQFKELESASEQQIKAQTDAGITEGNGVYVTFESEPAFPLKFDSLDVVRSGIELCVVRTRPDGRTEATVFVPDGRLEYFLKKIEAYQDEVTTPRQEGGAVRPKNQDLVESISRIRLAALEALWVEEQIPFPNDNAPHTWEVWLRSMAKLDLLSRLRTLAPTLGLTVGEQTIQFIDRTIVHVRGTASDLARSTELLGMIAELHAPQITASFFTNLSAHDQIAWVANLAQRIQSASGNPPYVCLFDTGVSHPHPLLKLVISDADRHSYKIAWGPDDIQNHGTPMAGLASFGDLAELLAGSQPVQATHRLESVKIIHKPDPHEPELYGAVTQECTFRVEVIPDRRRVYCMAVSSIDGRARGKPSSWSAAIDALASGALDNQRRLFVLSAGNTDLSQRTNYPNSNFTDPIHDPGQAWNAITVGGYTNKILIDHQAHPGWRPLAVQGDLAPASCTATTWQSRWPIKPDIVLEAGNMAQNTNLPDPDYIDDGLLLLSTSRINAAGKLLTAFGDTSAATALAAQLSGSLWAKYPNLTPESIRALLVHCARWTPEMLARFTAQNGSVDYRNLLRCFGYGVPTEQRLLFSLENNLTLVAQDEIEPFHKAIENGKQKGPVRSRELRLHELPWPVEVLQSLGEAKVLLRITLSYFVEPSPGERGWSSKYGYASHGLRFVVKRPLESLSQFGNRINKASRENDYVSSSGSDTGWRFGFNKGLTSLGSLHSDVWEGTATELAARSHIAIYPTMGWWNKRQHLEGWKRPSRYSLIVTIEAPESEVDIYTAVATKIGVPIDVFA